MTEKNNYFTHVPLRTGHGELYRWSMPTLVDVRTMQTVGITHVLVCCTRVECRTAAREDLFDVYEQHGLKIIHCEIEDFSVPVHSFSLSDVNVDATFAVQDDQLARETINAAKKALENDAKILAHCFGGRGRTGLVLACLVGELHAVSGREAISYLRNYFPAVENPRQESFVAEFLQSNEKSSVDEHAGGIPIVKRRN